MPRSKGSPKKLSAAHRAKFDTMANTFSPAKSLDMVREEKNQMLQEMMMSLPPASPKKSPSKTSKKKPSLKLKKRLKIRLPSPKPKACPAGCVPAAQCRAAKKTAGMKKEAKRLQTLEAAAGLLDEESEEQVWNATKGRYEVWDEVLADFVPVQNHTPSATPRPSKSVPTALAAYKVAVDEADARGDASFVHNGKTYVRESSGRWKKEGGSSPCTKHRKDPTACAAQPGCRYISGAKHQYCAKSALPKLTPLVPAEEVSFDHGLPIALAQRVALPVAMARPYKYHSSQKSSS
jgi:hypothetical protein